MEKINDAGRELLSAVYFELKGRRLPGKRKMMEAVKNAAGGIIHDSGISDSGVPEEKFSDTVLRSSVFDAVEILKKHDESGRLDETGAWLFEMETAGLF